MVSDSFASALKDVLLLFFVHLPVWYLRRAVIFLDCRTQSFRASPDGNKYRDEGMLIFFSVQVNTKALLFFIHRSFCSFSCLVPQSISSPQGQNVHNKNKFRETIFNNLFRKESFTINTGGKRRRYDQICSWNGNNAGIKMGVSSIDEISMRLQIKIWWKCHRSQTGTHQRSAAVKPTASYNLKIMETVAKHPTNG